jgi:hypothetical protein
MLECAIPSCTARAKFLRSGSLHLIDVKREDGVATAKYIWLCAACRSRYIIQCWRPPGEQLRLRPSKVLSIADRQPVNGVLSVRTASAA